MLCCKLLGLFIADFSVILQINFISYEDFYNGRVCMLVNALKPCFNVCECKLARDIKGYNDAISLLVERVGDSLEALLACCVPNLNWDLLGVRCFVICGHIVKSNCCHVTLSELLFGVHLEEGGLTYSTIPKNDNLDLFIGCHSLLLSCPILN